MTAPPGVGRDWGGAVADEVLEDGLEVVAERAEFGDDDAGGKRGGGDLFRRDPADGDAAGAGPLDVGPLIAQDDRELIGLGADDGDAIASSASSRSGADLTNRPPSMTMTSSAIDAISASR